MILVTLTLEPQVEMIRELRKATESLVQIGLSIGLQRITEVPVLFKRFHKYVTFQVVPLDDETYAEFDGELPQCQ